MSPALPPTMPSNAASDTKPRAVQVEGLRDVGTDVVATAVAGHAQDRLRMPVQRSPLQLLLQHHAVAVAARQRDPRRHAVHRAATEPINVGGKSGRFWCSPTSTASQRRRQDRGRRRDIRSRSNGAQLKSVSTMRRANRSQRG